MYNYTAINLPKTQEDLVIYLDEMERKLREKFTSSTGKYISLSELSVTFEANLALSFNSSSDNKTPLPLPNDESKSVFNSIHQYISDDYKQQFQELRVFFLQEQHTDHHVKPVHFELICGYLLSCKILIDDKIEKSNKEQEIDKIKSSVRMYKEEELCHRSLCMSSSNPNLYKIFTAFTLMIALVMSIVPLIIISRIRHIRGF